MLHTHKGMAALMKKMEVSVRALDEEVTGFVTNVTMLEDVAALLVKVNEESRALYDNLGQDSGKGKEET